MNQAAWSKSPQIEVAAHALPDEERRKFLDLPYYLRLWAGDLSGKKLLDFGCGSGITAAGICLLHDAGSVVGVDINSEASTCRSFLECSFGIDQPSNLIFEEIEPGYTTTHTDFDCIFSWSVFEHVNNRLYQNILTDLVSKLKPGGLFFVQIAPLYFSPEGSHLWAIGYNKWDHLHNQTSDVYHDIMSSDLSKEHKESLWSMFRTLNRVTADDLVERFTGAGLTLIKQQRDEVDRPVPSALLRAYDKAALKTHQIVALFRRD